MGFWIKKSEAQHIHFSQFQFSPMNHNPAFIGIFDGDQRFAALYRNQWHTVPVDYKTFTASYDRNFIDHANPDQNGFFSLGLLFNYDQAGDSKLTLFNFTLGGSYTQKLSNNVYLGAGAQVGYGGRNFQLENLTWDNQWDGTAFDPNRDPGENFTTEGFGHLDISAGLNLHIQANRTRSKLDIGVGAFHLNRPQHSFYNDPDSKLHLRFAYNLQGVLQVAQNLDLMVNGLYHRQREYAKTVINGYLNIHLSTKKARELQLMIGAGIRLDDSFYPQVAIRYDGWQAGFSYDITTSPFQVATDRNGGPELSLIYTIKQPRPLMETKNCRIF